MRRNSLSRPATILFAGLAVAFAQTSVDAHAHGAAAPEQSHHTIELASSHAEDFHLAHADDAKTAEEEAHSLTAHRVEAHAADAAVAEHMDDTHALHATRHDESAGMTHHSSASEV